MTVNGIYNSSFLLLERSLNLRLQKHNMVASNIANMDTPNYKPFNLMIEKAFEENGINSERLQLSKPDSIHLTKGKKDNNGFESGNVIRPQQSYIKEEEKVDIDKAMAELSENTLLYNASAQILSKKYNMIKQSITGGSR